MPAALAVVVLPGYFWARFLRPTRGLAERLAYSTALSMALVPTVALVIARVGGTGVTLWVALVSVALVLGSGAVAILAKGSARGGADPALPRPRLVRDPRALTAAAAALTLALVAAVVPATRGALPGVVALAMLVAGVLASRAAGPSPQPPGSAAGGRDPGGHPARPGAPSGPAAEGAASADGFRRRSRRRRQGTSPVGAEVVSSAASGAAAIGVMAGINGAVTANAGPPGPAGAASPAAAATAAGAGHVPGESEAATPVLALPEAWRAPALAAVLALTAFRAYVGVARHDWPFLRGGDMYSHAVMTEQMLAHAAYSSYLIYPPGFSTLTAVVCRLSGLPPLSVFPVLAPGLLILVALGAYALATRLWGWEYGVGAAALSGLVLAGAYAGLAGGRYPDLVDAYFLITMTVAALATFYQTPTARSGLLLVLTGACVVLYHSVATLYLAVLLAIAGPCALGYLLRQRRRAQARSLLLALTALAIAAAGVAIVTYGLPQFLGGGSATSTAVSIALGSQPAPPPGHVLTELAPAIVWLGAFGVAMMAAGARRLRSPAQVLTVMTMAAWCVVMYLGSRTAADGFPQRFERDLGAPLSVLGALALGVIVMSALQSRALRSRELRSRELRSRSRARQRGLAAVALATAAAAVAVLGIQTESNVRAAARPGAEVVSAPVAAAGAWLAQHNTGVGTIISTPYMNPGISNRAVLAMGGYTGLQSYRPFRIAHPRSLPPAGRKPLLDSQTVLSHPASCQAAAILAADNVQYVVLYRFGGGADLAGFQADTSRYQRVFANSAVVIYQPSHAPCHG